MCVYVWCSGEELQNYSPHHWPELDPELLDVLLGLVWLVRGTSLGGREPLLRILVIRYGDTV